MHNDRQLQDLIAARAAPWQAKPGFVVLLLLAWVLAVYGQTTWSMVTIWERSETFAHGFVVVPIVLYLLWRNRAAIDAIAPRPWLPALGGIALLGALWLVASRLRVNSVAQFAMVAMIPLSVWAVLGTAAVRVLAFPLAFLFFAVPVGEFMMPQLIEWTADVTVAALRATGVPVYREGTFFTIPTGRWSVVEACSGLRYLIASLMVGCLYAYLSFRSPVRRAIFVACAIAVPIVANWIRAYGIVMLGHLSQNRIAVGADHLLYGWLFFGIVMVLLFWIGSRWREDLAPAHHREVSAAAFAARRSGPRAQPGARGHPRRHLGVSAFRVRREHVRYGRATAAALRQSSAGPGGTRCREGCPTGDPTSKASRPCTSRSSSATARPSASSLPTSATLGMAKSRSARPTSSCARATGSGSRWLRAPFAP